MKGEKIIDALGKIDDRLVMAAIPASREHKRSTWPVLLAAAAVVALCVFAVPKVLLQFDPGTVTDPNQTVSPDDEQEPALQYVWVPTLSEDFPATVSEAQQKGIELRTLGEWGELGGLLPVYKASPEVPVAGEYPYWTPDQAVDRLLEGYGYCALKEPVSEPLIERMGLVYLEFEDSQHYVPYYWFSVQLSGEEEGLYFLPAIYDSFLRCVTWWKEPETLTMEEKIMALPDPDNVGEDVKRAFVNFMDYSNWTEKYLNYDMELAMEHIEGKGDFAVLRCRGPLMVGRSDSQSFHYDYEEGKVTWGTSGIWYSPITDLAENIRQMLLYRDADDAGSQEEYDKLVREAFAQYFIENKNVLMYLPSFDAETPPDRDALLLYAMLRGGLDTSSFTAEELDAAIAGLMEGVTFEHGPANQLQLENGVYTYLPYGLEGDMTYYRPENCIWNSGSNTYTLTLHGYTFSEEDFRADSTESSENWNALWTYLEQNTDMGIELSRQYLIQHFDGLLLSLLYADIPEDFGMKASETLTVTFRLQAGDDPMRFVSCKRETLQ